jgi:hypothetical protein
MNIIMGKCFNILILILLMEKCTLTHHFFVSSDQDIMLVPSIAFRYHSPSMALTATAQSSDDWMLYIQGYYFFSNNLFIKILLIVFKVGITKEIHFVECLRHPCSQQLLTT